MTNQSQTLTLLSKTIKAGDTTTHLNLTQNKKNEEIQRLCYEQNCLSMMISLHISSIFQMISLKLRITRIFREKFLFCFIRVYLHQKLSNRCSHSQIKKMRFQICFQLQILTSYLISLNLFNFSFQKLSKGVKLLCIMNKEHQQSEILLHFTTRINQMLNKLINKLQLNQEQSQLLLLFQTARLTFHPQNLLNQQKQMMETTQTMRQEPILLEKKR